MIISTLTEDLTLWLLTQRGATNIETRRLFVGEGDTYVVLATLPGGTRVRLQVKDITPLHIA